MVERVLEGTWEEIEGHAPELRGRLVRLTVFSTEDELSSNNKEAEPKSLADLFDGLIGNFSSGLTEERLSENTGEKFTDHLVQKHKEGHL